jgi:hypothetical protein
VGNLNLFGLLTPHEGMPAAQGSTQTFNIARNVRALEPRGEWTTDLQVTLVPYFIASPPPSATAGATPAAVVSPPGPWVSVKRVSLTAQ